MSDYIFLFDLDSTITKKEILPTISERIGKLEEMRELTEATMRGERPFKTSFLNRVDILKNESVSDVNNIVANIPLNDAIANFIINNSERCYVVTGNLDVWISRLMNKIGMTNHVYCSKANINNDHIANVISDGDNDSGMAKYANIAIGFGGVRNIAPSLLRNIDYAFYNDKSCAKFLETLL